MDDFGIANALYFQNMYRDIYPELTGIRLLSNQVVPQPEHLVECKLLDALIFVDLEGKVYTTLYDKRDDYKFFVNRFPDIDSNVSKTQSVSTFYGELVQLFRLNSHSKGFFSNVGHVAAYLIYYKRYPQHELKNAFSRFVKTQKGNPRLPGSVRDHEMMFTYYLTLSLEKLSSPS
jgi:hypothetical protein